MSWKSIYKNIYKTSNPNLFISAVCSFPNIIDTVEKAIVDYNVKALQKDNIHLKLEALYQLYNGRNYIPLYFEDDCPKLKRLPNLTKGMFWCILYKSEYYTKKNTFSSILSLPSFDELVELLTYSENNLKSIYNYFLFKHLVKQYIYENTKDFTDKEKHRRFCIIENSSLVNIDYDISYNEMIDYITKMKSMNIYEFMFKAYSSKY